MTDRQMNNRVAKLQGIEAQMKDLEAQAEAIRAERKADLESKGEDEHNTGSFVIRWKEIIRRDTQPPTLPSRHFYNKKKPLAQSSRVGYNKFTGQQKHY